MGRQLIGSDTPARTMCVKNMDAETNRWFGRYEKALCRYLKHDPLESVPPALRLGRQAVTIGLETLDLARFHEQAMAKALPPGLSAGNRRKLIRQANHFFSEATVSIERTHSAALDNGGRILKLTRMLQLRTAESHASTRSLEKNISRRHVAEAALKKSGALRTKLLQESSFLQKRLRDMMRVILSVRENHNKKTSKRLYNDISQTLLAVNIRLLALKNVASKNILTLKKEIADTRQLLIKTSKRLDRFANEICNRQEK